jgi:RNA polymerase sigma-70 factor (ECF subfamily)
MPSRRISVDIERRASRSPSGPVVPLEVTVRDAPVVWSLSDESLLAGLGSGEADASAAFVRRFQHRVFGLTLSILRDRGAAEEAAQETFVRAWRHASAFDPRKGAVAGWLLTIARNVSINMLPSRRVDPVDPGVLLEGASDPEGPEERATTAEYLRRALVRVPEEQRRALVLATFYGFTAKEISELDGVPLGTVKTRIRAAMMKLRSELEVPDDR